MVSQKANILVIEDEESNRASLVNILECEGYAVASAENGSTALSLAKRSVFDILLVDYSLPDMNGIDIIKQVLKTSKESVPIIITGASSLETALEGMRIGVHDYLVKPVNLDELLGIIRNILREREEFRKGIDTFQSAVQEIKKSSSDAILNVMTGERFGFKGERKIALFTRIAEAVKSFFR